jgi:hypothetical protein
MLSLYHSYLQIMRLEPQQTTAAEQRRAFTFILLPIVELQNVIDLRARACDQWHTLV